MDHGHFGLKSTYPKELSHAMQDRCLLQTMLILGVGRAPPGCPQDLPQALSKA